MKIRLHENVWQQPEDFGGVVYVHHRNDFFFLDRSSFRVISSLGRKWISCPAELLEAYRKLAQIGICETESPATKEINYSGPSFVGQFQTIPKVSRPLVLNCFATAFCPLACKYCHADDLMKPFRSTETEEQLESVIRTAKKIDSMVAVISGGDPLTRVDRTIRLIAGIGAQKPMVIDTSGVPSTPEDLDRLLPHLLKYNVHVRISLDGFQKDNDFCRPVNRKAAPKARSSYEEAVKTIKTCLKAGLHVTIQTVLSSQNDRPENLIQFAHQIGTWGVKNWVIHIATTAGKAREQSARPILPNANCFSDLRKLLKEIDSEGIKIDVRVTNTGPVPNAVFLVGSEGDLYTEGYQTPGKALIFQRDQIRSGADIWGQVNSQAHTGRYSNWVKQLYPNKSISDVSIRLFS